MNTIPRVLLNPDSFLFACHSADTARLKPDGSFHSHLRFDPFLMGKFKLPSHPTVKTLFAAVREISQHHFQTSPQFRRNEDIDLETISYFTAAITTLFADLNALVKEYTGFGLPKIPQDPPEYDTSYPLIQEAIKKHLAWHSDASDEKSVFVLHPLSSGDLSEEELEQEQAVFSCELWDMVSENLNPIFHDHADAILSYAFWKYQPCEETDAIDWRVRPPVGELFAKHFRLPNGARRTREDKRFGEDKRFDRNSPPPADKPFKKSVGIGPRPDRPRSDVPLTGAGDLEAALDEARKAIDTLVKKTKILEVALAPSNSFVRRQQHSLIVEMGYETESRGEGKSRAVFVRRKNGNEQN